MSGSASLRAAGGGVAAVVLGAGLGELTAAWLAPTSGPISAVGAALIALAPGWAKETAITLFGTSDKAALLTGIAVVLIAVAAAAGILQARSAPLGRVVCVVLGIAGIAAATTRADVGPFAWGPSAVAGAVAAIAIGGLVRLAAEPRAAEARPGPPPRHPAPEQDRLTRRRFFVWTGATALVGAAAVVGGALLQTGVRTVAAARAALHLPVPAGPAPPIPAGAALPVAGITPLITANAGFYRIDTALIVPQVDPRSWALRIDGMVDRPVTLTWDELLALPLEESWTTLACVSNEVGGGLIGNARWLGYPIRHLLARARPNRDADMVLSRSVDGFTASTPLSVLTDGRAAILAVGMNGMPLPLEHGFPVRMVVPGLYGYVSATKWVTELTVTRFDRASAYWTTQGWAPRGPVKLESRIDLPAADATVPAGARTIAGVAWQQHIGVSRVEVSVDDGPWHDAQLAAAISADTWVQWRLPWAATRGDHTIRCRATNRAGQVQTARQAPPAPDGATGWHEIAVHVS